SVHNVVSMAEMSEVVIVTLPEVVSNQLPSVMEEDKAVLVATELRLCEVNVITSVVSVSAVKLSEEVDVEADVFYPITCGDAKATLVWKKFVCPGINVKCVQFTDQLISPKEFVCLAGKSTLKDWKRAIRLNGTMLRKIMDSGELDFYQHSKVCSNTCRSTKIDLVGTKVSVSCDPPADLLSASASSADLNGAAISLPDVTEEPSEWVTTIGEDSVVFWRAVKEAGLLEEVVEDFQKEVQEMLTGLQERVCDPPVEVKDAVLLNNIVQNFGMLDLVKKVLASHKSQMDRYREQYTRSLAALEQQCDEHRKRAKELKSKSQHLNNVLMNLTPAPSPPTTKRPRLTRAVSGPAAVNATPTQIALPLGQLSGLTVAGAQAGGYTLLTSPLSGSELGADGSNVTVLSAATGQGAGASGSFVKVMGPQFQLVTLPLATQSPAVQQQVSTVTVVDAMVTAADELQEVSQADGEEEGQPGQAMEEEEEQQ
uniref:Glucocorticoid modulatory element binding protein 2 n=1 Tax=Xiphophorus couchianus TaxID=32473 RepID=A0A3B5L6J9_9TELE